MYYKELMQRAGSMIRPAGVAVSSEKSSRYRLRLEVTLTRDGMETYRFILSNEDEGDVVETFTGPRGTLLVDLASHNRENPEWDALRSGLIRKERKSVESAKMSGNIIVRFLGFCTEHRVDPLEEILLSVRAFGETMLATEYTEPELRTLAYERCGRSEADYDRAKRKDPEAEALLSELLEKREEERLLEKEFRGGVIPEWLSANMDAEYMVHYGGYGKRTVTAGTPEEMRGLIRFLCEEMVKDGFYIRKCSVCKEFILTNLKKKNPVLTCSEECQKEHIRIVNRAYARHERKRDVLTSIYDSTRKHMRKAVNSEPDERRKAVMEAWSTEFRKIAKNHMTPECKANDYDKLCGQLKERFDRKVAALTEKEV